MNTPDVLKKILAELKREPAAPSDPSSTSH